MAARPTLPVAPFRWREGERTIVFGRDALGCVDELLGRGFALLTTPRALAAAPGLAARAGAVQLVGAGRVDELAAGLRGEVSGELLVALGGGRVIDTAKALAAADPPRRVAAVPTTLSAAEMTPFHRHATGVAPGAPKVRPAIVLADPALAASQPPPLLAASAANALAHAAEALVTTLASPVTSLAALEAAALIAAGWEDEAAPGRDALALGALLSGWANGYARYGLHHVLSQTLARVAGVPHAAANAAMLPHTLGALGRRDPGMVARLGEAVGREPALLARALARRAGAGSLRELGVSEPALEQAVRAAAARAELSLTPPRAGAQEIEGLYRAALDGDGA